jgi:hypothetical protein
MTNPFSAIKSRLRTAIVIKGLQDAQTYIDTPEERRAIVEGIHIPGLPLRYAWVMAIMGGVANLLLEALSTSDPGLLLSDWHAWAHAVAVVFVGKVFLWIKQDSKNGTAVVRVETAQNIAADNR